MPAVMGQLAAGIILGLSVLGLFFPALQAGLFPDSPGAVGDDRAFRTSASSCSSSSPADTDRPLVKRVGRTAITVAAAGVAIPFACGFALGEILPDFAPAEARQRLVTALFLGTALSISSVKIVAMVVRELTSMRRNIGQILLASAILDDSIGWIIIAIISASPSAGTVDPLASPRA